MRAKPTPPSGSQAPSLPDVEIDRELLERLIPPYRVVLHNDEHNSMEHVVKSLIRSVPSISRERAEEIMMEAHNSGQASVIICPKETAEHYREKLESYGLTATIEPA